MTPEAQRIAIAEACGWTMFDAGPDSFGTHCEAHCNRGQETILQRKLPDYLNDLNAIHQAEQTIPPDSFAVYLETLQRIIQSEHRFEIENRFAAFSATAAQRAEAFLKTIGKWV